MTNKTMNIIPHPKRIIVKIQKKEASESGLLLTGSDTNLEYGEILAVGADASRFMNVGDIAYFKDWSLDKIEKNGEKVVFVHVDDYLGVELKLDEK